MAAAMNVLMVGAGKGSYEMRGVQLGNAIGARVTSTPQAGDWKWADVVVLIKRYGAKWALTAHEYGVPVVWDAVDFWSQPYENPFDQARATALLRAHIVALKPAVTVCATQAMADACGGVYLPHHSWRNLRPVKPQERVGVVGYQGNPVYLGRWRPALLNACRKRNWTFATDATNSEELWKSDIVVAFRDGPWDGWMCREWKSGVKLSNAIAAGRPVITQNTAAFREVGPPGWAIETEEQLDSALDQLTTVHARTIAFDACRSLCQHYTLPAVAEHFRGILNQIVPRSSCVA